MRKLKRLVSIMAIMAVVLAPFCGSKITALADGPTTFTVKYVDDTSKWRYQPLASWDDTKGHGYISELEHLIKDGDSLIIETDTTANICKINIPNVRLANLTVLSGGSANVTAKGFDEFYALQGCTAVVNGDVKNAHVYDYSIVNMNNNVEYLEVVNAVNDEMRVHATIGVLGTVDHFYAHALKNIHSYHLYNFKENTFRMNLGWVSTPEGNYSTTAPAAPATPAAPAKPSTGSSDYDDVPKTGEVPMPYIPVACVLVLCLAGKAALRKTR
ncbi:MAG: hypothetical protein IJ335_06765 [Lachnospiraceae bacterium]|nr:hypothetical protein [Lachnospiraceae bacterium]